MLRDSPSSFQIGTLDIVLLVLKGKIANFKISKVSDKGKEMDYVQVVGINGWD